MSGAYRVGALLVIIACTFFALNGIVARIAIDGGLSPISVAAVRTVGGALCLLPFVVLVWRRFTRAMLLPVIAYAAIGIFASQALYFQTLSYLDVALTLVLSGNARVGSGAASMLGMTEPVIGSIAARVIFGQLLSLVQIVGILITVVAVAIVEHQRTRSIHEVELPGMLPPLADGNPR